MTVVELSTLQVGISFNEAQLQCLLDVQTVMVARLEDDHRKWNNMTSITQIKKSDLQGLSACVAESYLTMNMVASAKSFNETLLPRSCQQLSAKRNREESCVMNIKNLVVNTIEAMTVLFADKLKTINLLFESAFPDAVRCNEFLVRKTLFHLLHFFCVDQD
jgi:hypothetical protein